MPAAFAARNPVRASSNTRQSSRLTPIFSAVFKKISGWNQDITKCKKEEDFPKELSSYIEYLEKELEVPISIVSVGPNRTETIIR